jgi:hypothetical protein
MVQSAPYVTFFGMFGADPNTDAPLALLIALDGYDGPEFIMDSHKPDQTLVSIFCSNRDCVRRCQARKGLAPPVRLSAVLLPLSFPL